MSEDNEGEEWKIEDFQRRVQPIRLDSSILELLNYPRLAVLCGREVVETADHLEWARMLESEDRVVEQTTVNRYWISTVFLGLNHNHGEGSPLWFETMVFEDTGKERLRGGRFQCHYATWEEAEAGHAAMVEIIRYGNF